MGLEGGNHAASARVRGRRGRVVTTGSVPSGASGLLGPRVAPRVARGTEPGRERVMEQTSE